jgi:hypothetical protein
VYDRTRLWSDGRIVTAERRKTILIERAWDGAGVGADERVRLDLALGADLLAIEVVAPFHGDPPPPGSVGSCDGLWEFEVVELFLVGDGERYLEIELSPHGHHLALELQGPRNVIECGLELRYACRRDATSWRGRAEVEARRLPSGLRAANAFAIHGTGPGRRYLAAWPTGGERPDFHRIASFPPLVWGASGSPP